ncbi:SH3 domain-containing protein [Pontibacter sp. MBLB2868]|uniref:SH3 domain-containing protein n=1 Tax=Pontibacter sp. MBLB2868 TaxID=3451555 RepID=UPI003F756754
MDQLNVRSGPGSDYAVIERVAKGQTVKVASSLSSSWVRIEFMAIVNGVVVLKEGYVSKKYLSAIQ